MASVWFVRTMMTIMMMTIRLNTLNTFMVIMLDQSLNKWYTNKWSFRFIIRIFPKKIHTNIDLFIDCVKITTQFKH